MKHQKIDLPTGVGRQFPQRERLTLFCEVRQGTGPWQKARLEDISQAGFRIAWLPKVREDTLLRIRIPGLQMLSAQIRWRNGHAIGCEFEAPLHVAVFEHIVARSRLQV